MYAVSPEFLAELRKSSMVVDVLVTASDGTTLRALNGSVSMDSRRDIIRTAELELGPTEELTTLGVYSLVMTPDVEITIRRGLIIDGVPEYVSLGVFSTDTAEFSLDVQGTVRWSGSDRSKKIARARFSTAYKIAKSTALATAGGALLDNRWAPATYNFSNVTETVDHKIVYDAGESSNPWASVRKLFSDYGYDLNFDGDGDARAVPVPDPATSDSVFDFGAGETNLMLGGTVAGTFEATYNGVVATGEGTGNAAPVRAVVWDTDPSSPTYYQSGFGKVPLFYSSPLLTTTAKATTAATNLLARKKGRAQQLAWSAIVNPALEPLDVVTLTNNGVVSRFVIDSLTIPLRAADPISAVARETSTTPFSAVVAQKGAVKK